MFEFLELSPITATRLRNSDTRIVVTGASGWLGQATLEMLEQALKEDFPRRICAFGSRAGTLALRSGTRLEIAPIAALGSLPYATTLLLHYAFVTKERVAGMTPDAYFQIGENIATSISAAIPAIGVTRMLFPSSGAVYGLPTRSDRSVLDDPEANPYGTQKLRDEARFMDVCNQYRIRLAIPRIFNLSGPFINKHGDYALASVLNSALSGTPIELRARRRVVRSYISIRDVLDAMIGWLVESNQSEQLVLDTGGEIAEVGDLAHKVLDILGRTDLPVRRPPLDSDPDDIYLGDGAKFEQLAAVQDISLSTLDAQIADTAAYMKDL